MYLSVMPIRFLILFVLVACAGAAQTSESSLAEQINSLIQQSISWKRVSRNDFSPVEKNTIGQLTKDSSNAFCLDFRIDGDYLDDFHLLDIDGDKDPDLIFEGFECAGLSTKTVIIYLNKHQRYEKALYSPGRLAELRPGSGLTLYKYPCCSMIDNTLLRYRILTDSLVEQSGVSFFFSPVFKALGKDYELILPKKTKTENDYVMKAGSSIYYLPKDSLKENAFISEAFAGTIKAESLVTAYASATDKNGLLWLYVAVPKDAVSLENNKTPAYPLMIWVKSTDGVKTGH